MSRMLQPHELTEDIKTVMRQKFEADPRVRELNFKAYRLQQAGNFYEALAVREQIETLYDKVMVAYCKEAESQVKEFAMDTLDIPTADKEKMNTLFVAMYMAVDIMDSCLMDINDTLHKTSKTLNYTKIVDLQDTAHLCRDQLKIFGAQADYLQYAQWGDITDNMYKMMQNKAKALINKVEAEKQKK